MAETRSLTKLTEAVVHEAAESLGLRIKKLYRRLTFEEIDQRRWKGLCIFCDELETPDHYLRHKNSGILMLDCDDDQPPNDIELVETEVAIESSETEQRTVSHEATADMNLALLEEESIPQFQVPISDSEILSNIKLREETSTLETLEYVVMNENENLEQDGVQKYVSMKFEVDGDAERSQKVLSSTKNCCAHQVFGKMSKHEEKLGIKKKRKGFKSRMFKYKRGLRKLHALTFIKSMRMVFSQQLGMVETSSDLLMWNGKDSLPETAIGSELEAMETDSSSQERSELCTENKEEVKGCFKRLQASVLMKEKPDSVKVNEVKIETQVVDRDMSLSIIVLETGREEVIGSHVTMAFVFKQTSLSYSPCSEHNLLDTMLLRCHSKTKQRKCHKSWMFKYKFDEEDPRNLQSRNGYSLSRREIQPFISQYMWTQEVSAAIRFLLRRHLYLTFDCEELAVAGRKRKHGLSMGLQSKQKKRKCPKSWMFKFKTGSNPAGTSSLKRHNECGLWAQIREVKKQSKLLLLSLSPSFVWRAMIRNPVKRSKLPKTWFFKYKQEKNFRLW
ncbi:hypothetical protein ISN44_As10g014390 [Arabidopsis suecica]|uniref:Uncharacterized protein n=1 Tax=Arabidopsis suecica TaxID=45249 RepID=A0A8T1ZZ13_ARASU|nr:hypothetical protein ISN44_As10g014390 [Arabidopsis suecica]